MAVFRSLRKLGRQSWQLAACRAYTSPGTEEIVIKDQSTSVEVVSPDELVRTSCRTMFFTSRPINTAVHYCVYY